MERVMGYDVSRESLNLCVIYRVTWSVIWSELKKTRDIKSELAKSLFDFRSPMLNQICVDLLLKILQFFIRQIATK